ncbi:patatin-like phospholipase family protein [Catenisphaera adipataccumulans]|uniref:Putative patatin/cPLA2 family phospholipase n=1 Tax=Catenisphaera adipataccumulans TaxID=700500 RepID=A0A7W8FW93_9FIRM|nr:patatin family protein [Catenisphaera adipataccumulans]MBB5182996.1 putative patatin/cPLA2 family phospholipase [Catenisphaera adipataccumulans]
MKINSIELAQIKQRVKAANVSKLREKVHDIPEDLQISRTHRVFSGVDDLPSGIATNHITEGCLVLEGGAFRGVYTSGVLDALMEADINLRATVGVSAGALNGASYVCGQIGRAARINLTYRHDSRYVGAQAMVQNHGVIGFDFMFHEADKEHPMDMIRFNAPNRRFVAVATNCVTGQPAFFEKGKCTDIFQACRASASMPYVSQMVELDGQPYLDGGCSMCIPFPWALAEGYEKIIVVKTRPNDYRNEVEPKNHSITKTMYMNYPEFEKNLENMDERYNDECNELEKLRRQGRVYVICPSRDPDIGRLERNMEKLGDLYYLGYNDVLDQLDQIRFYLNS